MRSEIRITGLGGQGAITAGNILARAAVLYEGKEAVMTEGYSPYVTGGWSRADVVISTEPIDYPLVTKLDLLVTMYQEGLDLNLKMIKGNGAVIAEKQLVSFSGVTRKDLRMIPVPATSVAETLGRKIAANVVLVGSIAALVESVSIESLKKALADRFPKAIEFNLKALDAGYELASKATGEHMEEAKQVV